MKNFFRLPLILIFASFLIFSVAPAHAYYDDVHYAFTYYAARAVGYTPQQAHRIASAAVMVDYDPETEPVQGTPQMEWLASRTGNVIDGNPTLARAAQQPRIDFHAFMDCLNVRACLNNNSATAVIPQKRAQLEARARESGNPGSLLHFVQDQVPHAGYPSDNGHWSAMDASLWNFGALPLGATTDFISYPGAEGNQGPAVRNRPTIEQTMEILKNAMNGNFRNHRISQKPRDYSWSRDITPAFQAIIQANPNPAPSLTEAAGEAHQEANFAVTRLWELYKKWKRDSAPNLESGLAAMNAQLANTLKATDRIPAQWIQYNLNEQGVPDENSRDDWALWGDLEIKISIRNEDKEIGKVFKPIMFKVFAAPTFQDQKEEELAKAQTMEAEPLVIHNLPIGDVIVEMRYEDRAPERKNVAITRLHRDVSFTLEVDKEDDQTKSLDDLLLLLEKMKELEKKSNEHAQAAELAKAELDKTLSDADGQIGTVINDYMTWSGKLKAWRAEIAQLESAGQAAPVVLTRAADGKQKALDAESVATETEECPPASVIEEGTEEEKKIHIQKAREAAERVKHPLQRAESGAAQAEAAANELAKLQAASERLSGEIQSAGMAASITTLSTASQSLDQAQKYLDDLHYLGMDLETVKTNADEIMKLAQEKIKVLSKDKNIRSKVDEIAKQIRQSYQVIVANYEKWKSVSKKPLKTMEDLKAQKIEMETKTRALDGEIRSLIIPGFDTGTASSDAETAKAAAQSVQGIAQRAAECPEQLEAIAIKQKDRILNLEVQLSSMLPFREDGTREYHIVAVVTVSVKEQTMITCERSDHQQSSAGQVGGADNYAPSVNPMELGRIDMRPGNSVTVSCYLPGEENKRISRTAIAPEMSQEEKMSRHDCSAIPNSKVAWNSAGSAPECVCLDGYEPNPEGGCRITIGAALRQKDCSDFPRSKPLWNDATREAYCGCLQGYQWNNTQTACITDREAAVANTDCSVYPNSVATWDEGRQIVMCYCPDESWTWTGSGCITIQEKINTTQCTDPNATKRWENGQVMCYCPNGYQWGANGYCEPIPQPQATQPPPDWGQILGGLQNTYNQGTGNNPPPSNPYGASWNPNPGVTPPAQLPGLGPTSGGSSGGGSNAGFTGFGGGTSNTGSNWVNTGYSPPQNTGSASPGINTGPGSPGVVTNGGDPNYRENCSVLGQGYC